MSYRLIVIFQPFSKLTIHALLAQTWLVMMHIAAFVYQAGTVRKNHAMPQYCSAIDVYVPTLTINHRSLRDVIVILN